MNGVNFRFLDGKLRNEKQYWTEKLSGDLPQCGVPLDFPRPTAFNRHDRVLAVELAPALGESIIRLCGPRRELILTLLIAAVKIVLWRYSPVSDIIVGTLIHEQDGESAQFNRILALRDRASPSTSVKEFLDQVRRTLTEAYLNQRYPFGRVLSLLGIEAPSNRAPLFNVAVVFEGINRLDNAVDLKNDLTIVGATDGDGVRCEIRYRSSLFRASSMTVFARHLARSVRAVVETPHIEIGAVDLLSPEERDELIHRRNDTDHGYPSDRTIHSLFEEQAARTPDNPAIIDGERVVSYLELNRAADLLARRLASMGAGRGARIGIIMKHSIETVAAILGVLKTGAAYVPLDPEYPLRRRSFMIRDSSIEILLTNLPSCVEDLQDLRIVTVEKEVCAPGNERDEAGFENPSVAVEDVAYVMYTSGSTGEPNGVEVLHRSLVNYIWWAKEVYLRDEALNVVFYSSLSFDLTVTSIYVPLITGNAIIVYSGENGEPAFLKAVRDARAQVIKVTPSHLSLMREGGVRAPSVRRLIVGGEPFETALARQVRSAFSDDVEIYNEYGPTETTVGCMIHRFDSERDDRGFVPIGRPAANTRIYILGENGRPAAENVIGELYVSGTGVGAGYINKPELTAERFLDDPFVPGARMYRTGDLARWLPEGLVEHVGRNDDQIKFHGHRIELNEIRLALNRHPNIRDSVVTIVRDGDGNDYLIAYYTSRQEIDPGEIRDMLTDYFVEETIPNFFVHLKKLPLSLNGKIDHRMLPSLDEVRHSIKRVYVAPSTPLEETLAAIWRDVLSVERVSARDNFFRLGGHSLLATRVVSRIRDSLGVEVPLSTLFKSPTVAELAEIIDSKGRVQGPSVLPPIKRVPRDRPLPLSFSQQRLWFLNQLEPGTAAYNIGSALQIIGDLDSTAMLEGIRQVIRRHEVLRTRFPAQDGMPVQVIDDRIMIASSIEDIRDVLSGVEKESKLRQFAEEEARKPFDLAGGPLIRARLLRTGEREHVLLMVLHHIVSDGLSMKLLMSEIGENYELNKSGSAGRRLDLEIQYADYAVWQREVMRGETLERGLRYWQEKLKGQIRLIDLPTDRPRPEAQRYEGEMYRFELGRELMDALDGFCADESLTKFMALLGTWQVLLHRYSEDDEITVGTPVDNRIRAELGGVIGCFINTVVMRTNMHGNPTARELLNRVKEVIIGAFEHQEVPFELIVERLQPERRTNYTPFIQVWFVLHPEKRGDEMRVREESDLIIEGIDIDNKTAQFDLALSMFESGQGILTYNTDLFDRSTIEQMVEDYRALLRGMIESPTLRILDIPLAEADGAHAGAAASSRPDLRLDDQFRIELRIEQRGGRLDS